MSTLTEYYTEFAARAEAAVLARDHAEAYHPARLLGIAQRALEDAASIDDPAEAKQVITDALARITPPAVTA